MYVFQLLHFLISIDEFRVFQVLLQYTFFYLVETMRRSPRECVTSQTPNTRPIWRRSLCIPIEDTAKAPLCLSLWRWDLFLHPSSLLHRPHTMRLAFLAIVEKWRGSHLCSVSISRWTPPTAGNLVFITYFKTYTSSSSWYMMLPGCRALCQKTIGDLGYTCNGVPSIYDPVLPSF